MNAGGGRLDQAQLEQIRQLDAFRPGTAARLVGLFEISLREQLEALRSASAAGDHDSVGRAAHSLKGVAASLGASELSTRASRVEADASKRDPAALGQTASLEVAIEATLHALSIWLTETRP